MNQVNSDSGVEFLDWTVDIVEKTGVVSKPTTEIESLPKGTKFSVAGQVEDDGYLYVIQVRNGHFSVLYPPTQPDQEKAGTDLRLPATGDFVAPMAGAVYVVEADHEMTNDDWKALFPVRDPAPATNHGPC